MSVSSDVVPY